MENLKLVLKFKSNEDGAMQVKGASRITIGRGGLIIQNPETGISERINLATLQSLSIQSLSTSSQTVAVAHAA